FHPETDGQTERTNQTFEQYLQRHREPPVPVEIEGQEEFEVQEVLDSKKIRGKL
ncbi:unnamed protein product, partial [Sphagnum jensenii]